MAIVDAVTIVFDLALGVPRAIGGLAAGGVTGMWLMETAPGTVTGATLGFLADLAWESKAMRNDNKPDHKLEE